MAATICFHCGDPVIGKPILYDDKSFCCSGCKSVFQILSESKLDQFYSYQSGAGTKPVDGQEDRFKYLDIPEIRQRYITFEEADYCQTTLFLPGIHCSSCIYLLEHLNRVDERVISCEVHFTKREATIAFNPSQLSLSDLALLLSCIGYTPNFGERKSTDGKADKVYLYKLGIAAFAFGSIMLWSFPEYVGIAQNNPEFRNFTAYLSLLVSIPVLLYSASDYFVSAWKAIRYRSLNLDVPITIGIIALYVQSCYTILSGDGPGYMDSFAGFIFFLLIGKWFQSKTYRSLAFDRDYRSYFPIAASRIKDHQEEIIPVEQLQPGDEIMLRNEEVLPCDATLISEEATIDFSFVTGESRLVRKTKGELIYAGAKLCDSRTHFKVERESNRSHLTQLWNKASGNDIAPKKADRLSFFFLVALLIVAGCAAITWLFIDSSRITEIVVSVLIVACPCALALSRPFTYGNNMRLLGRKGLYLKNTEVIDQLKDIDCIVFDKTGTLTTSEGAIRFESDHAPEDILPLVLAAVQSSAHPYSRRIGNFISEQYPSLFPVHFSSFQEQPGKGIQLEGTFGVFLLGSANYLGIETRDQEAATYCTLDGEEMGRFVFSSVLRPGISEMLQHLSGYPLHLVSGDNTGDEALMQQLFPSGSTLHFHQTPQSKLDYIRHLQKQGHKVLMVGDGLNDSGALMAADAGISISDTIFQFTPSSDAIIDAAALPSLPLFLRIAKFSTTILRICFAFSIIYNLVGLTFALSGQLSPIVAALLMPISSITIVVIATFGTLLFSPKQR